MREVIINSEDLWFLLDASASFLEQNPEFGRANQLRVAMQHAAELINSQYAE